MVPRRCLFAAHLTFLQVPFGSCMVLQAPSVAYAYGRAPSKTSSATDTGSRHVLNPYTGSEYNYLLTRFRLGLPFAAGRTLSGANASNTFGATPPREIFSDWNLTAIDQAFILADSTDNTSQRMWIGWYPLRPSKPYVGKNQPYPVLEKKSSHWPTTHQGLSRRQGWRTMLDKSTAWLISSLRFGKA